MMELDLVMAHLEKEQEEMPGLETKKIYLCGHSFGGATLTQYLLAGRYRLRLEVEVG